jgi:diaminopimelate decarboxylase
MNKSPQGERINFNYKSIMEKIAFERPVIKKLNAGMPGKFGIKSGIPSITHIDQVAVKDLITVNDSPLFVISENTLRKTCREAKEGI